MVEWLEKAREVQYFVEDHSRSLARIGLVAAALLTAGGYYAAAPQETKQDLVGTVWRDNRVTEISVEDQQLRDTVLKEYGFTPQMVWYLDTVPFVNRKTTLNGGGLYHGYDGIKKPWIEVFSASGEAILHEYTHAAYDVMEQDDPNFGKNFEAAMVDKASKEKPGDFEYDLMFGFKNKVQDFKGLWTDHNYTEMFASEGSFRMGGVKSPFPQEVSEYYGATFLYRNGKPKDQQTPTVDYNQLMIEQTK